MISRYVSAAVFFFLAAFLPSAQEADPGEAGTFPPPGPAASAVLSADCSVSSLLDAAGDLSWRPHWPPETPPDAFTLPGGAVSLTLEMEAGEYRVRGDDGAPAEFPVYFEGRWCPGTLIADPGGGPGELRVAAEVPLEIVFLQHDTGARPLLARVTRGDTVCFTALRCGSGGISETWYDRDGNALAFMDSRFDPGEPVRRRTFLDFSTGLEELSRRDYDGAGNITEISSPGGNFSALYDGRGRPRYWERRIPAAAEGSGGSAVSGEGTGEIRESYTLQWDQGGFLVRITGTSGEEPVDYRYEYTLDERGNWTERREIRMIRRFGLLTPVPGPAVKRIIEYGPDEVPEAGAEP
ncbi:MAG: hypothetical protein LBP32_02400 [Spirochaetaceae bacterium]|jgi:hypothetical protein|nr:hypothetical protein [Spirochaetaceae bacterium]